MRRTLPSFMLAALIAGCANAQLSRDIIDAIARAENSQDRRAAQEAISLRARLIEQAPRDPHRPIWLADQALAHLDLLRLNLDDWYCMWSDPDADQRERVRAAAIEALSLVQRAETEARRQAEQFEVTPTLTAIEHDLLRTLRSEEITLRLPYLRARALLLLAFASEGEAERADAAREAADLLTPLRTVWKDAAHTRVLLATALAATGDPAKLREAEADLNSLAETARAIAATDPTSASVALIAGAVSTARVTGTPTLLRDSLQKLLRSPVISPTDTDAFGLLAADAFAAEMVRARDGISDKSIAEDACAQYQLVFDASRRRDDRAFRAFMLLRAAHVTRAMQAADLPALARLARGVTSREPSDAVRYFREAAGMPAPPWVLAEANARAAAALLADNPSADDRIEAVRHALAAIKSGDPAQAHDELLLTALTTARQLCEESPSDLTLAALYLDALTIPRNPTGTPYQDYWSFEFARVTRLVRPDTRWDQLAAWLRPLLNSATMADHARSLIASVCQQECAARRAAIENARKSRDNQALTAAAAALRDTAQSALNDTAEPAFRLHLAEALVELADPKAEPILATIASEEPAGKPSPPRLRLALARCALAKRDSRSAFSQLRDLAADTDAPPKPVPDATDPAPTRIPEFWHAWTLMIEILADNNSDGSRSGVIRANAARLRAVDDTLGGEPWRSRIDDALSRLP